MRIVSITFDDGLKSSAETAMPILDQYQFKATFYVVTGWVEPTRAKIKDLYNQGRSHGSWDFWRDVASSGHEVGAHSFSHIDFGSRVARLFPWVMVQDIARSADDLQRELSGSDFTMAMPYNYSSSLCRFYAKRHFSACRIGSSFGDYNSLRDHDPYKLNSHVFQPGHGWADLAVALDRQPEDSWLIFQFHTFGEEGWAPVARDTFERLCGAVQDRRISVKAVKEVVNAFAPTLGTDGAGAARNAVALAPHLVS